MIDPSKNEYIIKMFNDGLYKSYRKKEVTLLRKPLTPEIETVLYTYVGSHKESSSVSELPINKLIGFLVR